MSYVCAERRSLAAWTCYAISGFNDNTQQLIYIIMKPKLFLLPGDNVVVKKGHGSLSAVELGARLKWCRVLCRMNIEAVAKQVGVSTQAISKYEKGDMYPTVDNLRELASLYKINLGVLLA